MLHNITFGSVCGNVI